MKAFTRLINTWGFRNWPLIDQKVIFVYFVLITVVCPILIAKELVYFKIVARKPGIKYGFMYIYLGIKYGLKQRDQYKISYIIYYVLLA